MIKTDMEPQATMLKNVADNNSSTEDYGLNEEPLFFDFSKYSITSDEKFSPLKKQTAPSEIYTNLPIGNMITASQGTAEFGGRSEDVSDRNEQQNENQPLGATFSEQEIDRTIVIKNNF